MLRFITKNPGITLLLCVVLSCVAFGPARTGAWIHVHAVWAIHGAWAFVCNLVGG